MNSASTPILNHSTPERILVVLPNNLGDVLMATPVLAGLKASLPHCFIAFLVEKGFEGGLVENPHCDVIIPFARKSIRDALLSVQWSDGLDAMRTMVNTLKKYHFTQCINLCQHAYIATFVSLLDIPHMLGKRFLPEGLESIADNWSRYLYTIPFARSYNVLHAADVYRRIAGVGSRASGYVLRVGAGERVAAKQRLMDAGIDPEGGRIVLLQPGAAVPSKKWPVAHFITLGRRLLDQGWRVIISGAPVEAGECHAIANALQGRPVVTAGTTSFREAIAIASLANVCVTGDTALMHVASALGVATVALFGSTNPVETGPYGSGHIVMMGRCRQWPCFQDHCPDNACMEGISPEDVYCTLTGAVQQVQSSVYKTELNACGDLRLVPVTPQSPDLFDREGSSLVLRFMGEPTAGACEQLSGNSLSMQQTMEAQRIVNSMIGSLQQFLASRDMSNLRSFEHEKAALGALGGIGNFWAAFLNIGLNGIALLEPLAGLRASLAVCTDFVKCLAWSVKESPVAGR